MANSRNTINKIINYFLVFTLIFTYACVDKDNFDFSYDKAKEIYEKTYPVKDIDKNQDWSTSNVISLDVSVNEDALEKYVVKVYDACPFGDSIDIHKLAESEILNGDEINIKFDCPKIIKLLWVSRVDSHKRRVVRPISIENTQNISMSFGEKESTSRSIYSRAGNDIVNCPLTSAQVQTMLNSAVEVPSGSAISRKPIENGTYSANGYYKLPKNVDNYSFVYNDNPTSQECYFIIDKEVKMNNVLRVSNGGLTLIVANGGKIVDTDITILNGSNIIVMQGGEIDAKSNTIEITNASEQYTNYNFGKINIGTFDFRNNATTFYNNGYFYMKTYLSYVDNSNLCNNNYMKVETMSARNSILTNNCLLECSGDVSFADYKLGENSCLKCNTINYNNGSKYYIYMSQNSILNCQSSLNLYGYITGPTTGYALIQTNTIVFPIDNWGKFSINNNIYCDIKDISFLGQILGKFFYLNLSGNGNASIVSEGEAPISIPKGDCTGEGYKPTNQGGDKGDENVNTYTFCYEDYYPYAGDYDFNDIVMDMSYELKNNNKNISELDMKIKLVAVGATYELGSALQLVGIDKNRIKSIDVNGNKFVNSGLFNSQEQETSDNNYCVIPLFDNAHYQLSGTNKTGLLNTAKGHEKYADSAPAEINIVVKFKTGVKDITLDNLDLFVARNLLGGYYKGQNDKNRIEIHLFDFWKNRTNRAVDFGTNEEAAAHRTWAICVPNFKYPYEFIPIYKADSNGEVSNECAYPKFGLWAKDRISNEDWFMYPNPGKVYR